MRNLLRVLWVMVGFFGVFAYMLANMDSTLSVVVAEHQFIAGSVWALILITGDLLICRWILHGFKRRSSFTWRSVSQEPQR